MARRWVAMALAWGGMALAHHAPSASPTPRTRAARHAQRTNAARAPGEGTSFFRIAVRSRSASAFIRVPKGAQMVIRTLGFGFLKRVVKLYRRAFCARCPTRSSRRPWVGCALRPSELRGERCERETYDRRPRRGRAGTDAGAPGLDGKCCARRRLPRAPSFSERDGQAGDARHPVHLFQAEAT